MATPLIWIDDEAPAEIALARPIPFVCKTAGETMLALGQLATLDDGPLADLAKRAARFFEKRTEGPDVLVGALPFDPSQPSHLVQPERVLRVQGKHDIGAIPGLGGVASSQVGASRILSVDPDPAAAEFAAAGAAVRRPRFGH